MKLKDLIASNGHCEIPEGASAIPAGAFDGCAALKSVRIPDSVTEIGRWAFAGCTQLKSVRIPDSCTRIGGYAFSCCTALASVRIPDSCTAIGDFAFYGCTALPSVKLPRHTAIRVSGDWLQCGCKCERLRWWESDKGKAFAERNGYTEAEYATAIEQLRKLCQV